MSESLSKFVSKSSSLAKNAADLLPIRALIKKVTVFAVLIIIVAAAGLYLFGFQNFPFYPFSTTGKIYVDSPEVYTRERLVNDRYDQDHWLREQLKKLDNAKSLLTGIETRRIVGGYGKGELRPETQEPQYETLGVPFDQQFRIQSGVRDKIRQLVLENMLDDRHDLTGNSVYGLKFDMTVVPGENTHKRAFARISFSIDPLVKDEEASEANSEAGQPDATTTSIPSHVRHYFTTEEAIIKSNRNDILSEPIMLFRSWLENIQFRLNNYVSGVYNSGKIECYCGPGQRNSIVTDCETISHGERIHTITWDTLEAVLSINQRPPVPNDPRPLEADPDERLFRGNQEIRIPRPWSQFLKIDRIGTNLCKEKLRFVVAEVTDLVYLFFPSTVDGEVANDHGLPDWAPPQYFQNNRTEDGVRIAFFNKYGDAQALTREQFEELKPHYPISTELVRFVKAQKNKIREEACFDEAPKRGKCERSIGRLFVPSGFFNFVEIIAKTDAYSYAVFPKNEVIGLATDSAISGNFSQALGGSKHSNAWAGFMHRLRQTSTSSVLVGFGDGSQLESGKIEFGWIVGSRARMEPLQKAQLALVSVPAWTTELTLEVTTGWLDRNSDEEEADFPTTMKMKVPLPPDFEAFDTFVGGSQFRRQPKILDNFLADVEVIACRDAEILIPGFRLWRSTAVTLGAQKADRITVLPNMQGIIAKFSPVHIPNVRVSQDEPAKVRLRVWTSEGSDVAEAPVRIRLPNDDTEPKCSQLKPPLRDDLEQVLAKPVVEN